MASSRTACRGLDRVSHKHKSLMHRQFSNSTIWMLRLGSLHFVANIFFTLFGIVCLTAAAVTNNQSYSLAGFLSISVAVISILLFKLCSSKNTCPVCVSRIWANSGVRKHKQAKKCLGMSYRLRIAMKVLTLRPYRCPYCGERFSSKSAIR